MNLLRRWLRQPQRVWLRRAIFQIHLWTGLTLGLYVVVLSLTEDKVVQLYYQDPKFGFSLVQLVIRPLLADWAGRPGAAPVEMARAPGR